MYNLLQFWNVAESIATFTLVLTMFRPLTLLVGDESFGVDARDQSPTSIKVVSLPHKTLCISMLDLRRRPTVTAGSKISGNCRHQKDDVTNI